jgi:hypothetical protein
MKNCFSTRERPARTPPSTFLFLPIHFSNSPGTGRPPPSGKPESRRNPLPPRTVGCRFTVPVRSFKGATSRRGRTARRSAVYRLALGSLSTGKGRLSWASKPAISAHQTSGFTGSIARALIVPPSVHFAPHSGHIRGSSLAPGSRDGTAGKRGHSTPLPRP